MVRTADHRGRICSLGESRGLNHAMDQVVPMTRGFIRTNGDGQILVGRLAFHRLAALLVAVVVVLTVLLIGVALAGREVAVKRAESVHVQNQAILTRILQLIEDNERTTAGIKCIVLIPQPKRTPATVAACFQSR